MSPYRDLPSDAPTNLLEVKTDDLTATIQYKDTYGAIEELVVIFGGAPRDGAYGTYENRGSTKFTDWIKSSFSNRCIILLEHNVVIPTERVCKIITSIKERVALVEKSSK